MLVGLKCILKFYLDTPRKLYEVGNVTHHKNNSSVATENQTRRF